MDGVEQSYVDLRRPLRLRHTYVRRIGSVIDAAAVAGRPVRILHLGGGGLTLPRYVAATRPGSQQVVIERDADLDAFVRQWLPLPPGADIRTVTGDARAELEHVHPGFDLVITDVYDGARMPGHVASVEFVRTAAGILDAGGTYVVNVTDLPMSLYSRIQAATLREVFPEVVAIAEPGMFRGRRYGNVVLAAGRQLPVQRLAGIAGRDEVRARVVAGADLDAFVGGVGAMRDSPRP